MQATGFQNASDARPYRAISDSDRTHVFTLSGVWELPIFRGRRFGGWQVNGTAIRQSGTPLGFGNALFIGNVGDIVLPKDQRSPDRWFNTDAGFNKISAQQLANNIQTFRFG